MPTFPSIASLKTAAQFTAHVGSLGIQLPFAEQVHPQGSLAQPLKWSGGTIGNRFSILPMEGWDGETDGKPSDLTRRRWKHFGLSGAKFIWGGEAVAVRHDGRANPNQLLINEANLSSLASLREDLLAAHREYVGSADDLLLGLQLTHSGRFSKPNDKKRLESRTAYRHPLLDARFGITDPAAVFSDDELARLTEDFIRAAVLAAKIGFAFVDIKHCHGYLGHEILSAVDRPGRYGGSLENRTRFLSDIAQGIRAAAPGLHLGVRASVFDFVPFQKGSDQVGVPSETSGGYRYAFGGDGTGLGINLTETSALLQRMSELGIELFCSTAGSPYYNPHLTRPAAFPPSDGYLPPEDPLIGVARQLSAAAELKRLHPKMLLVGSGYSYLQEWLPNVGEAVVQTGGADFIGLGRMVLSYPEMPRDVLAGKNYDRKKICRTFSDCTTAPRNGMISGCYPLDPWYKDRPEREEIARIKSGKS